MSNPTDYYKSWIAYESLKAAVQETNYRTVWETLRCDCCPIPFCWGTQTKLILDPKTEARIRWYDHILDATNGKDFHQMRAHFVGHHQRIELVLLGLSPSLDRIYNLFAAFKDSLEEIPSKEAQMIMRECQYASNGWYAIGQLVHGVSKIDRIKYLKYVPNLAGVSGGNSPMMIPLTSRTTQVEKFFASLSDEKLADALLSNSRVGELAEACMDLIDSLSRAWMDHVVTATTAIGITKGTKGTPNTILVDRVLKRLHSSRLLLALGSLRAPITGIGIEMQQLHQYQTYPLADHYLDLFEDPGPEFACHNIGYLPRCYDTARSDFLKMRRNLRTDIWEYFYQEVRPSLCSELCSLLGVPPESVHFGLGANVTEVLARIMRTVSSHYTVHRTKAIMARDEFVTLQREVVSLGKIGMDVELLDNANELMDHFKSASSKSETEKDVTVVFVSLINSCTQQVNNLQWAMDVPESVIVIIDVTQAICNVPLNKHLIDQLVQKNNVFAVGSLIKHAHCAEGIGFLTCAAQSPLSAESASGWTAYISGLQTNKTADLDEQKLYYDRPLEWDGGTVGCLESAYVASQVLRSMPPVEEQHRYVESIKTNFLENSRHLFSDEQLEHISDSNTIAIPISYDVSVRGRRLPFGLDTKVVNGKTFLRIGFGIHNLEYHLVSLLKELGVFLNP
ncbi:MAG: hypothetical protein SGILL_005691 [Bacillariaceae sp.]